MNQAIVRSRPEYAGGHGRFGERKDARVPLGAGHVQRHRSADGTERCRIVQREVGTYHLPTIAVVRRAKDTIGGDVELVRPMPGVENWKRPLKTVRDRGCGQAVVIVQTDTDVFAVVRPHVVSRQRARVGAGDHGVRIARFGGDVAGLAAAHRVPIFT